MSARHDPFGMNELGRDDRIARMCHLGVWRVLVRRDDVIWR
jgi:hypothetical protein